MQSSIPVLLDIITLHADEAAFLWGKRKIASLSWKYDLDALCTLDNRLFANFEGLELSGEAGWNVCREKLDNGDAGDFFAAAVISFGSGNKEWISQVLEKTGYDESMLNGIISALGWMPYEKAEPVIQQFLDSSLPEQKRIGIAASAIHRNSQGLHLLNALLDNDLPLRTRALKATGELGRIILLSHTEHHLTHDDAECRFYAAWSATLLGKDSGIPVLKNIAATNNQHREEAVKIAMRKMKIKDALAWQSELSQSPETLRLAAIGAGAIGDPVLMPWIIAQMSTPELARMAGEAFTMITGVDIAYEDLEGAWPEGFETGPNDDPEDENITMDADGDHPWPNPELIGGWWENNKGRFSSGTRYLLGQPITPETLHTILRTGRQRQRYAATLELAIRQPGQALFNVRAPGFRQRRLLAS